MTPNQILKYYIHGLKKCTTFSGRSTRAEYNSFFGLFLISIIILLWLPLGLTKKDEFGAITQWGSFKIMYAVFVGLFMLLSLCAKLAMNIRRLHDLNCSGWWMIPLGTVGAGFLFLMIAEGNPEENNYGKRSGKGA